MRHVAFQPVILGAALVSTALVAGAVWLAVARSDGMVIDLAALAGLAICF